jgi:hypothetical protein
MTEKDRCFYASYPKGYERLAKKIVPVYLRPAKDMLMRLLVTILKDG